MLRFVLKREVLPKTNENSSYLSELKTYHIKTLMLWECEQKPQTWWSVESSVVKLCSLLLQKLCDWISKKCCQHYFVSECNLFDHFVDDTSFVICSSLNRLVDASVLLKWFVENYIREVVSSFSAEMSAVFTDICCTGISETADAVNAIAALKSKLAADEQSREYALREIPILVFFHLLNPRLLRMTKIKNIPMRSRHYLVAVASLRIAFTVSIHGLSEDLLEVLWWLFDPCTAAVTTSSPKNDGLMSIRKAIKLATLSNVRSNALEMLHDEMSKAYLHQSFICGLESTYRVVHLLLAAFYYKSQHSQEAIDHCKQVLSQSDREHDGVSSIGAKYLPQIDERVDAVFGLIMLYEHVRRNATNSYEQSQLDSTGLSVLTIELLARYLYSQCSTTGNIKDSEVIAAYRHHVLQSKRPLVSDVLLFKAVEIQMRKHNGIPVVELKAAKDDNNGPCSMDTTLLVTMLEQVALEKLIAVRHQTIRELSFERFPLVNEFEVLHAYRCGLIEECLEMCRSNVGMLLRDGFEQNQFFYVGCPEFLSLLDGELVSLFGILRMLHPTSLLIGCLDYMTLHPTSSLDSLADYFYYALISLLTFSLYLMVQCLRKLCSDPPIQVLRLIRFVHDKITMKIDRLVLKLSYRLLKLTMKDRRERLP